MLLNVGHLCEALLLGRRDRRLGRLRRRRDLRRVALLGELLLARRLRLLLLSQLPELLNLGRELLDLLALRLDLDRVLPTLRLRLRLLPRELLLLLLWVARDDESNRAHAFGSAAGRQHLELLNHLGLLGGAAAGLLLLFVALLALLRRRGRHAVDARVEVVAAPVRLGGLRESYQSGSESGHSPSLTARE